MLTEVNRKITVNGKEMPLEQGIDTLARTASQGTLKRVYLASGDSKIRDMRYGLNGDLKAEDAKPGMVVRLTKIEEETAALNKRQGKLNHALSSLRKEREKADSVADRASLDSDIKDLTKSIAKISRQKQRLTEERQKIEGRLVTDASDGIDCYMVAYSYLWERIAIDGMSPDTEITVTLKSGKEKTRTVVQWASVAVRSYINDHASFACNPRYTYIEDLTEEDGKGGLEEGILALDRIYIRSGKYQDIGQDITVSRGKAIGSTGGYLTDLEEMEELLNDLPLSEAQRELVIMRLKGMTITQIATSYGVSHQAITKRMDNIRHIVADTIPESIRYFKGIRKKREA